MRCSKAENSHRLNGLDSYRIRFSPLKNKRICLVSFEAIRLEHKGTNWNRCTLKNNLFNYNQMLQKSIYPF